MLSLRVQSARLGCGATLVGLAALGCGGEDDATAPDSTPVASITVTPPVARIAPTGAAQLRAIVKDGAGTTRPEYEVTWSSRNQEVATVSTRGLVSGISAGETVVTAASQGKTGSATVTVRTSVESVELRPSVAQLSVSETLELAAITRDGDGTVLAGRRIAWSSSDHEVATVSQAGFVTGIAPGTAKITAMTEGEKGSALITVISAP